MSLTGVILQHSNCNCDLEVAGDLELQRRRTGWAGLGSGHRYRDRDRHRVWTRCTRHSASRRRSDVVLCRDQSGDYRKEKSSFRVLGRSSVEALGLRLSFLKTYTVWRPAAWPTLSISVYGPEWRLGQASRTTWNRPLYLLLSGFARGQALGCHAVARADRMQKNMQKHCRDTENDQSVVLNCRLPVSTFSPNHWSCCHLLAPHWAEIDHLAELNVRVR